MRCFALMCLSIAFLLLPSLPVYSHTAIELDPFSPPAVEEFRYTVINRTMLNVSGTTITATLSAKYKTSLSMEVTVYENGRSVKTFRKTGDDVSSLSLNQPYSFKSGVNYMVECVYIADWETAVDSTTYRR